jgi:hypothetical protein
VHGGATLQEVVIPVISINKKRQSDVGKVEVELIGGGGKTITTGQLAVVLYQTESLTKPSAPVACGLYTLDGERSPTQELSSTSSGNPRERELRCASSSAARPMTTNNQQVELRWKSRGRHITTRTSPRATRFAARSPANLIFKRSP